MVNTTVAPGKHERADAAANHTRIIVAARAVFAERGLDAEMREIAERAGVAVGTLYRHFTNRDDLLRGVLKETCTDAMARLQTAAAADDPRDALRAVMHTIAAIHQQFETMFALLHDPRMAKLHAEESWDKKEVVAWFTAALTELVTRGIRSGIFRADLDADVIAPVLMGAMFTFELLTPERSYDALADTLADFYLTSLTAHQNETD